LDVQKTYKTNRSFFIATYRKLQSGNWFTEVKMLGVRDSKGGFPTKAHAIAWSRDRESEIQAEHGTKTNTGKNTLHEALTKYSEEVSPGKKGVRWEQVRIKKFQRDLSFIGKLIQDVTSYDIAQWRDACLKKGLQPSTVNREMNLLSNLFTKARKEWKWVKSNPVQDVERPMQPPGRDRLTTPEEKKAMLDALGHVPGIAPVTVAQRVAYAYLISLETAMRASEICVVDKKMKHLDKKYIRLQTTKNGKRRDVALSNAAAGYWEYFPDGIGLTPAQIDSNWRKYRAVAAKVLPSLKSLTFHDACHQAITDLAKKLSIMELSRTTNKSIKTLMIYYNETATAIAAKLG
jgi:integrase